MKYFILTLLVAFIGAQPLYCQLKKGDLSIGFNSQASIVKDNSSQQTYTSGNVQLSPKVGLMVNDKIMLGAGLSYGYSKGENRFSGKFSFSSISINPFFRYYLYQKKNLLPYMFIDSGFSRFSQDFELQTAGPSRFVVSAAMGFGADFFIAPNLAVQVEAGTPIYENRNAFGGRPIFYTSLGVRLYINDPTVDTTDIMQRYFQKGNNILSGFFRFTSSSNSSDEGQSFELYKAGPNRNVLTIAPKIEKFIKDKQVVSLSPLFAIRWDGNSSSINVGLDASVKRFYNISDRLYFVSKLTLGGQANWFSLYTTGITFSPAGLLVPDTSKVTNSGYMLNGNLQLALNYFTEKSRWFVGSEYLFKHTKRNFSSSRPADNTYELNFFTGVEYFFVNNISLETKLSYRVLKNRDGFGVFPSLDNTSNRFQLDFSLKYLIFKNK